MWVLVCVSLWYSNARHSCVRQIVSGAVAKIHHWLHGHSGSVGPPAQWKSGNSDGDDAFVEEGFDQLVFSGILDVDDYDCGHSGSMSHQAFVRVDRTGNLKIPEISLITAVIKSDHNEDKV